MEYHDPPTSAKAKEPSIDRVTSIPFKALQLNKNRSREDNSLDDWDNLISKATGNWLLRNRSTPSDWGVLDWKAEGWNGYTNRDQLASGILQSFELTLYTMIYRNPAIIVNRVLDSIICWCEEGVFIFYDSLSRGAMINRSISRMLDDRIVNITKNTGPMKASGGPYFKKPAPKIRGQRDIQHGSRRTHSDILSKWEYFIYTACDVTGGLEILEENDGIYSNKDELASKIFENFELTLTKDTKILVDGHSDITICLCAEGVFIFEDSFERCAMINAQLKVSHLLEFFNTLDMPTQGGLKSAGRSYLNDIDQELKKFDPPTVNITRGDYSFSSPVTGEVNLKQNHNLELWRDLIKFYDEKKSEPHYDEDDDFWVDKSWNVITLDELDCTMHSSPEKFVAHMAYFGLNLVPSMKMVAYLKGSIKYTTVLFEEGVFQVMFECGVWNYRLVSPFISVAIERATPGYKGRKTDGVWMLNCTYFPQGYIAGQAIPRHDCRGRKELWRNFAQYMSMGGNGYWDGSQNHAGDQIHWRGAQRQKVLSYWDVLEQDSYGGRGNLASKIFKKFRLRLVRGSPIIQKRGERYALCLCIEGVFEIESQNFGFISTAIQDAFEYFQRPEVWIRPHPSLKSTQPATIIPDAQGIPKSYSDNTTTDSQGITKIASALVQAVQGDLGTWEGVLELWAGFVKEMAIAGWEVHNQHLGFDEDIIPGHPFCPNTGIVLKNTQVLQDPHTASIVLLSKAGVLQLGYELKYRRLISKSIPKALRYFITPKRERETVSEWTVGSYCCDCSPKLELSISQLVESLPDNTLNKC